MHITFFGSSKYSLIGAKIIHEHLGLSAIITLPDRPDKRGDLKPTSVKAFADEQEIPVLTTNKLTDSAVETISAMRPDFLTVEDYGLILPKKLLKLPQYASLNIHHSLLPKYRGSSPAPSAILAGEKITGVSIITMAEKVDAGDILAQQAYTMTAEETTDPLLTKLNTLGAELVIPVIKHYLNGTTKPQKQDESKATYTKQFTKQDGFIDLTTPPSPKLLDQMIRAYYPWPTVWTKIRIKNQELRIKFLPGEMIQVEGGKQMTFRDFFNGYPELAPKIQKLFKL